MPHCLTQQFEGDPAGSLISAQAIKDLSRILSPRRFRVTLPLAVAKRFREAVAIPPPQGQSRPRGAESGAESKAESGAESQADGGLAALVLQVLARGPLSKSEIAQDLGRDSVSGALNHTIRQLLDREEIGYTLPHTPNSRLQKDRRRGRWRR